MFQFLSAIPQLLGGAGSAVAGMPGMAGQMLNSIPQMAGTALPYVLGTPQKALGAVGDLAKGAGGLIQDIMGGGGGASTGVQGMNVAAGQAGANPGAAMVANATNPATYGGGATVPMAGATGVAPQGGGQGFLGKAWDAWSNFFNDPNKVGALGAIGAAISPQGSPSANLGQFAFQMSQNAKAAQEQAKQAKKDEEFMSRLAGMIGGGGFGGQGGSGVSPAMSATPQLEGGYTPFQNPQSDFKSMQSGGFASSPQTSTVNPKTATSGQPSAGRGTSSAPTVASEAAKTPIVSKASSPADAVVAQVVTNRVHNKPAWTILTPEMQAKIGSGQSETWNKMMDLARLDLSLQSNQRAINEEYRKIREEDRTIRQTKMDNALKLAEEARRKDEFQYKKKRRSWEDKESHLINGVLYQADPATGTMKPYVGTPEAERTTENMTQKDTSERAWLSLAIKQAEDYATNLGVKGGFNTVEGPNGKTIVVQNQEKFQADRGTKLAEKVKNAVALGKLDPSFLVDVEEYNKVEGVNLWTKRKFIDDPKYRVEVLKEVNKIANAAGMPNPITKRDVDNIAQNSVRTVPITTVEFNELSREEQSELLEEYGRNFGGVYVMKFLDNTRVFNINASEEEVKR